ncbi:hypothetical protein FNV43_RR01346 [Rhamnella rubrinervis]|uniref:Uncharacterized protein n=1 Tax=Rhamnella rubrinervis TaxID=2594499 RepID=A0A8K0HPG4_9ROSA|nr:hypothetical protein FNV43_RR01346 [Rhamnella rubrinervis]
MASATTTTTTTEKMTEQEGGEGGAKQQTAAENNGEQQKVSFFKLFMFADKLDVVLMIVGTLGAAGNGASQPLMVVIFGQLIDSFGFSSPTSLMDKISKVSLNYVYLAIGTGIAAFLRNGSDEVSCWTVTGERQATRIRGLYLRTILRQDIAFFDIETSTGEVIERMSGDSILIQDAMGDKVGKFIQFVSGFLGGFAIAFVEGWLLSLVLLSCIPAIVIAAGGMAIMMSKMSSRGQVAYAEAGNVVEQTVGAIRTVASFTGEKRAIEKYKMKLNTAYDSSIQQGLVSGLGVGVVMLILVGTYGLAIWYGSKLIIEEGYTGGNVMNVIFAIMTGGMSLGQAFPCINAFASGKASAYKMFETINRKPRIDAYDDSGIVLDDIRGEIELKDVYFRYPARPDAQIFSGFSLHVPSGKHAALVGQSGSGKSTIISLLERFYDPDAGEVLIDGVDLKKLKLKFIRGKIGLVSQEPVLFSATIMENIAYGKENASEEDIRKAIELANAAKFIDKLPKGLYTLAGERGTQLSGGQKQRIAIARAILKNPRILLLDEATSALDSGRIHCSRGTGTHTKLIKDPDGAYSQLVRLQKVDNESENTQPSNTDEENTSYDFDKSTPRSGSQRSLGRSISSGSLSSRHSMSLRFDLPGAIEFQETEGKYDQESSIGKEVDPESHKKISIKRLAYLNKPELPVLFVGSVAAIVHGVLFPAIGFIISNSIVMFYEPPSELRKDSKFWSLMFLGFGCVCLVVSPVQNFLFGVAGEKLVCRIRLMTFEKVVHQEISWFDDSANSSGAVGARLFIVASTVKCLVGEALGLLAQNGSAVVAALTIAFTTNWIMALIVLSVSPILVIVGLIQERFLQGFSADAKVMFEESSQVANDAVGSIRTISSFCAEKKVLKIYQKKCEASMRQGVRLGVISGAGFGFSLFALFCITSLLFYIGGVLVKNGKATFGEVITVYFALTMLAVGVYQTSAMAHDTNKAKDSAASIFEILDSKPNIDSSSNEGITLPTIEGSVEFEHVSFKYPTRPDIQIFRDLCLSIPSGKTVALVGESGSGKSTAISLIERFYDPDSGCVTLDGVKIQRLKLSWLRQQMGLVSQEPTLFNETIRDNIAYGKQGDVTEEEIVSAAKTANAHVFISSSPHGYDTLVGERGIQLSGGQKQRIAIARAILKNPKILLLDEATSALDAETERVVQDALDRVMMDRTTIVVAHRLTAIKGADVIAVLKNGMISEKGTHEFLMKIDGGAYASLVALQMSSST